MTEIEEKCLKAQIELYKGVYHIDRMIINCVQSTAQDILNKIIKPNMMRLKEEQVFVELTLDEFKLLRDTITKLSSNEGFNEINGWIKEKYINPKIEKLNILSLLE